MYFYIFIFNLLLFFILTPGIIFRFSNKSKYAIALIHAFIFGCVFTIVFKYYKVLLLDYYESYSVMSAMMVSSIVDASTTTKAEKRNKGKKMSVKDLRKKDTRYNLYKKGKKAKRMIIK